VTNFKSVKNPARWLVNFIRAIPPSGDAFANAMKSRSNGLENAGLRSIVGMHRACAEVTQIVSTAYSANPNVLNMHLGWVSHLQAAREAALRNEQSATVLNHASQGLASLMFCVAAIDDLSSHKSDESISEPEVVLTQLKEYRDTLFAQTETANPAKRMILAAADALIESMELIDIVGFEGVLDSVTRSCVEFLVNAELFAQEAAQKEKSTFHELCKRTLESVGTAGVYDLGKALLGPVAKFLLGN
jgi:hypothetical protein